MRRRARATVPGRRSSPRHRALWRAKEEHPICQVRRNRPSDDNRPVDFRLDFLRPLRLLVLTLRARPKGTLRDPDLVVDPQQRGLRSASRWIWAERRNLGCADGCRRTRICARDGRDGVFRARIDGCDRVRLKLVGRCWRREEECQIWEEYCR